MWEDATYCLPILSGGTPRVLYTRQIDIAESVDEYQWPVETDMASTSGQLAEPAAERRVHVSDMSALQEMEVPEKQFGQETKPPVVPIRLQAMEEVAEVDIGTEIKLPAVPDEADIVQDPQATIEVQIPEELEEMDTYDPATDSVSRGSTPVGKDTTKAGHDCTFLDPELASEYNCSICLSVAQEPQQTKCCGSTFCLYCIQQALESSKVSSCPACNSDSVELIPDKAQRQKINKLKVHCPIEGCSWIVELADVEAHKKVPHPLSPPQRNPPTSNHHSRDPREQYYNTLPAQPHKKQQPKSQKTDVGGKRPVPTPRVVPSSDEHQQDRLEYINLATPQPDREVPEVDSTEEHETPEYLNLTLTRPRVPQQRPDEESSLPHTKKHKVDLYVNIDAVPQSPPQPNQEAPLQSETEPFSDHVVPHQDQTQQSTPPPPPPETHTANEIYENIAITTKPHARDDTDLPKHESEVIKSSENSEIHGAPEYLNVTLRPRVPRNRSSLSPPASEQHEEAHPSREPSLPPQDLSDPPIPAQSSDQTPQSPSNLAAEVAAPLPAPSFDEFGMMHFHPEPQVVDSPGSEGVDEPIALPMPSPPHDQQVPSSPQMANSPLYVNMNSPGPLLPSLPDDLLALLDSPTSPQPDQLQEQSMDGGTHHSPLFSPQLHTHLLTLPEQLLNMIQPLVDREMSSPSPVAEEDYENAPLLPLQDGQEYVNTAPHQTNEEIYVEVSPLHEGCQSDYVEVTSPLEDESSFEYVPMSPFHEETQPDYVEMAHQENEGEETGADYVPMSPPPLESNQTYYVEITPAQQQNEPGSTPSSPRLRVNSDTSEYSQVPLLQDTNQPEYEDIPREPQAGEESRENQTPASPPPLPVPPEVVVALHQAEPPEEENYETIPAATESEDTAEHIYELLPPPRSSTPPEEPDQAVYADVPDPPASPPPPALPSRSPSQPPEPQTDQEPLPLVPPRPTSSTTPQHQNQNAPTGNEMAPSTTTDAAQPQADSRNREDNGVAALDQILQELQQGQANELVESFPPPQYNDLSQAPRYIDLVLQQHNQLQAEQPREAFIIQNPNTANVAQPQQGAIRADNINVQYQMGDRLHHRNKNMKKTQTLLWLFLSILAAVVWLLLVIPLSVAALFDALSQVDEHRASLVPSCHYSVPLLFVVILTHMLAAAFVVYWFSKCCKCARTKKASRVATSMTAVTAVVYAIVMVSFAVSVFVFVNKTSDGNDGECIRTNSPPFLFATFYLIALLLFLTMAVLMTCCDYHYKRKKRNFLLYLKDTLRIYENEGREDDEEETTL